MAGIDISATIQVLIKTILVQVIHFGEKNQSDAGWINGGFVEACDQDRFYRDIADSVVGQRPIAGGLQPFFAKSALKAEDPEG